MTNLPDLPPYVQQVPKPRLTVGGNLRVHNARKGAAFRKANRIIAAFEAWYLQLQTDYATPKK